VGCVAAWLCGCVAAWLRGCLAAWLHGCMAAWLHGCVAVWLCGCETIMPNLAIDLESSLSLIKRITELAQLHADNKKAIHDQLGGLNVLSVNFNNISEALNNGTAFGDMEDRIMMRVKDIIDEQTRHHKWGAIQDEDDENNPDDADGFDIEQEEEEAPMAMQPILPYSAPSRKPTNTRPYNTVVATKRPAAVIKRPAAATNMAGAVPYSDNERCEQLPPVFISSPNMEKLKTCIRKVSVSEEAKHVLMDKAVESIQSRRFRSHIFVKSAGHYNKALRTQKGEIATKVFADECLAIAEELHYAQQPSTDNSQPKRQRNAF
jgi:hypothetical protein